jgi:hypothetical protein
MRCSHIIRFTLPIFTLLLMLIASTAAMKPAAADGEEGENGSERQMQLPIKKRPSDLANSVSGVDDSAVSTTSEDDDGTEEAAATGLGEAEEAAAGNGSPILGLLTAGTARNSTAKKIVSQAAMASSFGRVQSAIEVGEDNKKVTWEHFSLNPNESVNLQGSGSKFMNVFVRNPRKRKLSEVVLGEEMATDCFTVIIF